jgi:glucose-1-phosphate cytidylyltransferase
MKLVILAGGRGTRLTEETLIKPKPLVDIGNKPIIWHIMKIYSHYGINDFIICLGYKGYLIKEYFANYFLHNSDLTIDLKKNSTTIHQKNSENWKVTLVDTGDDTLTGGRILKIKKYIKSDFLLTYGDGLSNVNINKLIHFHKNNRKLVTVTAIQPQGRFGIIDINKKNKVTNFKEKPKGDNNWINGGFFVLKPGIFNFLENESSVWEKKPLTEMTKRNQVMAFKHNGFWQAMDTVRDKILLDNLWDQGKAPWKIWNE